MRTELGVCVCAWSAPPQVCVWYRHLCIYVCIHGSLCTSPQCTRVCVYIWFTSNLNNLSWGDESSQFLIAAHLRVADIFLIYVKWCFMPRQWGLGGGEADSMSSMEWDRSQALSRDRWDSPWTWDAKQCSSQPLFLPEPLLLFSNKPKGMPGRQVHREGRCCGNSIQWWVGRSRAV